jgi:hypothetical protein
VRVTKARGLLVVIVVVVVVVGWLGTLLLAFERGEIGGDDARENSVGVTLRMVEPRMYEYSSRRRSRPAVCMVLSGVPAASLLLRLSRDCSMAGCPMFGGPVCSEGALCIQSLRTGDAALLWLQGPGLR